MFEKIGFCGDFTEGLDHFMDCKVSVQSFIGIRPSFDQGMDGSTGLSSKKQNQD